MARSGRVPLLLAVLVVLAATLAAAPSAPAAPAVNGIYDVSDNPLKLTQTDGNVWVVVGGNTLARFKPDGTKQEFPLTGVTGAKGITAPTATSGSRRRRRSSRSRPRTRPPG